MVSDECDIRAENGSEYHMKRSFRVGLVLTLIPIPATPLINNQISSSTVKMAKGDLAHTL